MGSILFMVLVMIGVIIFLAWFTNIYTAFSYKKLVSDKFATINLLLASSEVPISWRIKWLESFLQKNQHSVLWQKFGVLLHRWYIFKLKNMITYISRNPIIKSNDKEEYIEVLKEVQSAWEREGSFIKK